MNSRFSLLLSLVLIIIIPSCNNAPKVTSYLMENINLDPIILSQKQIYIHFTNSTIYKEFNVEKEIRSKLEERNFNIKNLPEDAPILINANLKFYGLIEDGSQIQNLQNQFLQNNLNKDFKNFEVKIQPDDDKKIEISDFLITVGGTIGGFLISSNIGIALLSGIGLYTGSKIVTNKMKPKVYLAVIDVVVSEYSPKEIEMYDFRQVNQGFGGIRKTEFTDKTTFKHYQSRIFITSSNQNLLDVKKQIIQSVVGII